MAGLYKEPKNVKETDNEATQQAIADKINEESEQEEKRRVDSTKYDKKKIEEASAKIDEHIAIPGSMDQEKIMDYEMEELAGEYGDKAKAKTARKEVENAKSTIKEQEQHKQKYKQDKKQLKKQAKYNAYRKSQKDMDDNEFTKHYYQIKGD